jgi:NAD kinase
MKLKKVLLSTKKTALEYYKEKSDFLEDMLPPEDLKEVRAGHNAHYASLDHVRKVLTDHGIDLCRSYMPYSEYEDFRGKDLVICVGGDGTVLNSAQYVSNGTPVLTVRSDKRSAGTLCEIDAEDFETALNQILADKYTVEQWTRAEGRFRDKRMYSLNEIYVGIKHSPSMARYEIAIDGTTEAQMSSGVVFSTGAGSTAWYGNIPGSDGTFPRTAKELRFIVREHNLTGRYKLTKGIVAPGHTVIVNSKMNIDGCISFDGDSAKRMYDFGKGESVEIRVAETPVNMIRLGELVDD